jgi:hypothetical protein
MPMSNSMRSRTSILVRVESCAVRYTKRTAARSPFWVISGHSRTPIGVSALRTAIAGAGEFSPAVGVD